MTILYGISQCDTVKKARRFLDDAGVTYQFHDFRKNGLDKSLCRLWLKHWGWELVLNRRGTTWRKLDAAQTADMDAVKAVGLMLAQPSVIKRPILQHQKQWHIGFDPKAYQALFAGK